MALGCAAHDGSPQAHNLHVTNELFAVTSAQDDYFHAVCAAAVSAIPTKERMPEPTEDGLDIHWLFSAPNLPGITTVASFSSARLGDYRFSISSATAKHYLPRVYRLSRAEPN